MDIFVVLTGKRGHGKDTLADIAIKKFGCAGKVALADWFKEELSRVFKVPLATFYDTTLKEKPFDKPVVVTRRNIQNLLNKIGEYGFMDVNRLSTMRWEGRLLKSPREMMLWFGHEFVTKSCGDLFHCKVTEERKIPSIPRKLNHANIIFITDARKYPQSKYFIDKYKYAFPVLISRPSGSDDDHAVEKSVDEFPQGYFFAEVVNDGSFEDLEEKIHQVLLAVKGRVVKTAPDGTSIIIKGKKKPNNKPQGAIKEE